MAGVQSVTATVMGDQDAEPATGALVSASLLPMLGVTPMLGRNFLPDEDRPGGPQVVLLSESLWRRRYGADPAIVGRSVALDVAESWGRRVPRTPGFTVVGVLPASFSTLVPGTRGDLWLPLAPAPNDSHDLLVIARLKEGTPAAQAKAALV